MLHPKPHLREEEVLPWVGIIFWRTTLAGEKLVKELPLWMLKNIFKTYGERYEKFKPLTQTTTVSRDLPSRYCGPAPLHRIGGASSPGNLEPWEYRYWVGDCLSGNPYSKCRRCNECYFSPDVRRNHNGADVKFPKPSCARVLDVAYANLRDLGRCVVCEFRTPNEKWGVPLCPTGLCIQTWMFNRMRDYRLLKEALEKAVVL